MSVGDWNGRLTSLAKQAFQLDKEQRKWFQQLRVASTLNAIRPSDAPLPKFTFLGNERELIENIYLLRLAELARPAQERRRCPGALFDIAQAFEDLARLELGGSDRQIELLAGAATMWSLAGYQANSVVLARELARQIEMLETGSVSTELIRIVAALLQRDVKQAATLGQRATNEIKERSSALLASADDEGIALDDAAILAAYGLLGKVAMATADFWRAGADRAARHAIEDITTARRLLLEANIVDIWLLVDNLRYVLQDSFFASTWHQLRGAAPRWNGFWSRHLRLMASTCPSVVEIWPSQRTALKKGLLDPSCQTLVMRMPTSAGKTHLAEFAILSALADGSPGDKIAAYVVPSRALAAEVETKLIRSLGRTGLAVSALFGGFDHVDYEINLLERSDVLVVTAEKLDLLIRQDEELVNRLSIIILDEGHLIGDPNRGLGYELLINRIRRHAPEVRLIFLSAVLPNVEDVGKWLDPGGDGRNIVSEDWTPSRLLEGVFYWVGEEGDGQLGRVEYPYHGEFYLPYVLRRRRLRKKFYPHNLSEIAAELAIHYQFLGPVLVGASTTRDAESVAKALQRAIGRVEGGNPLMPTPSDDQQRQLDELADHIDTEIGRGHNLAEYVRMGVAYHHAGLPEVVRQAIEAGYRRGILRLLVATSTLGQGVNLPAHTVIVSHTYRNKGEGISVREYKNLAGRVGRAFRETEGHVILVAQDRTKAYKLRDRYIASNPENVQSILLKLYAELAQRRMFSLDTLTVQSDLGEDDLDNRDVDLLELQRLDLQLLAILTEEVVDTADEEAIEAFLGTTLCAVQLRKQNIPVKPLSRYLARRFAQLQERVPDQGKRKAFYRTGLCLQSCEVLSDGIDFILISEAEAIESSWFEALRDRLLDLAITTDEIVKSCRKLKVAPESIPTLAKDWMSGVTINEIHDRHKDGMGIDDITKFTRVVEQIISRDLPWVLSSAIEFVKFRREGFQLYPQLTTLPAMAKFGLPSVGACFAASAGFRNRELAQSIGAAFERSGGTTFVSFLEWLRTRELDDIIRLVPPTEIRRFLERVSSLTMGEEARSLLAQGMGTIRADLRGLRFEGRWSRVEALELPADVILEREPDNEHDANAIKVLSSSGEDFGYVAREVTRALAPLMDDGAPVLARLVERFDTPSITATLELTVSF